MSTGFLRLRALCLLSASRSKILRLLFFLLAFSALVEGVYAHTSLQWIAVMQATIRDNPVHALNANFKAYSVAPWLWYPRNQLSLTVARALRGGSTISEEAADVVFEISRSANPYALGVLLPRIEYLLSAGRFEEAAIILAEVNKYAPHSSEVQRANRIMEER